MPTRRRRNLLRMVLAAGGGTLLVLGVILAANALGTLLAGATLSPWLLSVGGMKFVEVLLGPIGWLVGGGVMAIVGLGLAPRALNLRSSAEG